MFHFSNVKQKVKGCVTKISLSRYHNDRMINYDKERGVEVSNDDLGSTLTLKRALVKDSGNYTCSPYNIKPSSVTVHVLSEGNSAAAVQNGETPPSAAVQSSGADVFVPAVTCQLLFQLLLATMWL